MNTQTLVTNVLTESLKARGLTLITDTDWANTGTYRAVAGSLQQVLEIRYNFQTNYATFTAMKPDGTKREFPYVRFTDMGTAIAELLNMLPIPQPKARAKRGGK